MSLNQNNSLLLNRTVQQHPNRFLNANLNTAGSSTDPRSSSTIANNSSNSSNNTMFNLPNTGRKISKSVNISSSLNPSALGNPNGPISSYQYNQYNSSSYSTSSNANAQSTYPMIKNHSTPNFGNTSRKFSTDYQQASKRMINDHYNVRIDPT